MQIIKILRKIAYMLLDFNNFRSFSILGHMECNFPDVKQRILDKHCLNFLSVNSGLPYCIGDAEKINYQHQSPSKI